MKETPLEQAAASREIDSWVQFANQLADSARAIARGYFRSDIAVESKEDATPVTVADREIESHLRNAIETRYPEHGIIGEEHGIRQPSVNRTDGDKVWVIDPIDGTQAFITGVPLFGTLISLLASNAPVLGIIEMPALEERWVGVSDTTVKDGRAVHTSALTELAGAALFATSPHMFTGRQRGKFDALGSNVKCVRYGTDCYAYGLLADGFVDLVVEADMAPHDYMALIPVVQGAGGVFSDWNGLPVGLHSDGRVIAAATPQLHAAVVAQLQD